DADTYPIACDATFDPLTFTIGDWEYFVDHKQLIIKDPKFPFMCFLGIAELKVPPGYKAPFDFLLGDPWVRQFCQVHDFKQKRIGFAVAMP
ncbi:aspartyl protease precursor, partial [Aphelenchoides avenae]